MKFIPKSEESILTDKNEFEIFQLLNGATLEKGVEHDPESPKYFFGSCDKESFSFYSILKRPNQFVPMVDGIVMTGGEGSTILIRYTLLSSTRNFLIFWSAITALSTLFFALVHQAYIYALIAFSAGLVNYLLSWEKFKQEVRKSSKTIHKVLNV